MKYETYQLAIGSAVADLIDLQHFATLQILVLGAGRGPLVTAAINAVKQVRKARNIRLVYQMIAVEKNPNACVSLKYCNEMRY